MNDVSDHHGAASQFLRGVRCLRSRRCGGGRRSGTAPVGDRRDRIRARPARSPGPWARWPTSTGNYLDSHPQTNQALTTISQQQGGPQSLGALKTYFDANPQAGKDMQAAAAAADEPVRPVQAADHHSAAAGPDAGRAAAGRRTAVGFARQGCPPHRLSAFQAPRCRAQRPPASAVSPGARTASRAPPRCLPASLGDARSAAGEAAELQFPDFLTIG